MERPPRKPHFKQGSWQSSVAIRGTRVSTNVSPSTLSHHIRVASLCDEINGGQFVCRLYTNFLLLFLPRLLEGCERVKMTSCRWQFKTLSGGNYRTWIACASYPRWAITKQLLMFLQTLFKMFKRDKRQFIKITALFY